MSIPLIVGPNKEQKEIGEEYLKKGIKMRNIGALLILVGIVFALSGSNYAFSFSGSALGFIFGFLLSWTGGVDIHKGRKLLEIKFTGELDKMTPYEFEILIDDIYKKMGYKCENIQSSRYSGADVIAIKDGIKYRGF